MNHKHHEPGYDSSGQLVRAVIIIGMCIALSTVSVLIAISYVASACGG